MASPTPSAYSPGPLATMAHVPMDLGRSFGGCFLTILSPALIPIFFPDSLAAVRSLGLTPHAAFTVTHFGLPFPGRYCLIALTPFSCEVALACLCGVQASGVIRHVVRSSRFPPTGRRLLEQNGLSGRLSSLPSRPLPPLDRLLSLSRAANTGSSFAFLRYPLLVLVLWYASKARFLVAPPSPKSTGNGAPRQRPRWVESLSPSSPGGRGRGTSSPAGEAAESSSRASAAGLGSETPATSSRGFLFGFAFLFWAGGAARGGGDPATSGAVASGWDGGSVPCGASFGATGTGDST